MARPTTIPSWATAITPSTPSAGTLQTGAVAGQAANPTDSNWAWKYTSEWSTYLSELSSATGILDGVDIVGDYSGTHTLRGDPAIVAGGSVSSTRTQLSLDDGGWQFYEGVAIHLRWRNDVGVMAGSGLVVTAGTVDDGFRYGYTSSVAGATGLSLVRNLSQSPGLWGFVDSAYASPVADHEVRKDKAQGAIFVLNGAGSTQTIEVERDLLPEAADNAAARGAGGTVYTVTALEGEIGSGLATNVLVQIVRRTLGSGTESVLATLPSSGTPETTASLTAHTNTGLSLVLDFNAYAYTIRTVSVGVVANSGGGLWRDLKITLTKGAVE